MASSSKVRGAKETYSCSCCGSSFIGRVADRRRGWAIFCSKSCKASGSKDREALDPKKNPTGMPLD